MLPCRVRRWPNNSAVAIALPLPLAAPRRPLDARLSSTAATQHRLHASSTACCWEHPATALPTTNPPDRLLQSPLLLFYPPPPPRCPKALTAHPTTHTNSPPLHQTPLDTHPKPPALTPVDNKQAPLGIITATTTTTTTTFNLTLQPPSLLPLAHQQVADYSPNLFTRPLSEKEKPSLPAAISIEHCWNRSPQHHPGAVTLFRCFGPPVPRSPQCRRAARLSSSVACLAGYPSRLASEYQASL
ncbi:hypothetical protein GGP41_004388 [Bipolaris sorokiniana]|uniref:Uncharacterized protein n=1 Tax=Cochliobolus sativus TaxID=45130 RepID=A0A8H6DXI4_COCSA|nr:hypothetical protein GGP41_004388 [Bipolaris sorokiniana]